MGALNEHPLVLKYIYMVKGIDKIHNYSIIYLYIRYKWGVCNV